MSNYVVKLLFTSVFFECILYNITNNNLLHCIWQYYFRRMHNIMEALMMNLQDKQYINELKEKDPHAYAIIQNMQSTYSTTMSQASHDIKNIISTMGSSFQFLEAKHPETSNFRFWNELGESIHFLIEFMDQTSAYRYSISADKKSISLEELLFSIPDHMDELFANESRNFEFDIDANLPTIIGDPEKINLAIIELVKNAFEATSTNAIITICAKSILSSNDTNGVIISIIDHGTGISDEIMNDITKPFYTTKSNHTGVGLSIVNEVANNHNGQITITSKDNTTTVSMSIC